MEETTKIQLTKEKRKKEIRAMQLEELGQIVSREWKSSMRPAAVTVHLL